MSNAAGTARLPITTNLRASMRMTQDADSGSPRLDCDSIGFGFLCDAIDSVHANLERENERLKVELDRVLGEQEDAETGPVIGSATVEISPRIDWSRMADELDVFTQLVRGFAEQVEVDE